jgi:integrase
MAKKQETSVTLRWRALDNSEWKKIDRKRRDKFQASKGKKNPPVRGEDIDGRYYLDIYAHGKRSNRDTGLRTTHDSTQNDEKERLAWQICLNYQDEQWREQHRFGSRSKGKIPFIEYFETLVPEGKTPWRSTLRLLQGFPLRTTPLNEINYDWLSQLQKYLLASPTRADATLTQNSASTYYAKVKTALRMAYQQELIPSNPASKIKAIQQTPSQRVYLTREEVQLLADTPCDDPEVKRAFLFSCFTGLRLSDVRALTWNRIRNGRIELRLIKTGQPQYMEVSDVVKKLLGPIQKTEEPVFSLPHDSRIWIVLQFWGRLAGIAKHLSFHVSRHSFATMMLDHTNNLFMVSNLLGHTSITHTQVYAKIMDSRRKEAILSLPSIEL